MWHSCCVFTSSLEISKSALLLCLAIFYFSTTSNQRPDFCDFDVSLKPVTVEGSVPEHVHAPSAARLSAYVVLVITI